MLCGGLTGSGQFRVAWDGDPAGTGADSGSPAMAQPSALSEQTLPRAVPAGCWARTFQCLALPTPIWEIATQILARQAENPSSETLQLKGLHQAAACGHRTPWAGLIAPIRGRGRGQDPPRSSRPRQAQAPERSLSQNQGPGSSQAGGAD